MIASSNQIMEDLTLGWETLSTFFKLNSRYKWNRRPNDAKGVSVPARIHPSRVHLLFKEYVVNFARSFGVCF